VRRPEPARRVLAALLAGVCARAAADGYTIDKVYHPYVEQARWELEWRATQAHGQPHGEDLEYQRLGLGHAVSEYLFAEGYLVGKRASGESLDLAGYEGEVLWQLSDQGEFAVDCGALFELEKRHRDDAWEASSTLLLERELGDFSVTANLGLLYEWGEVIRDEWEASLAAQARYRYAPRLEPALELYVGENTFGLGPVVAGSESLGGIRALGWEGGVIFGLDDRTADYTLRLDLELEF